MKQLWKIKFTIEKLHTHTHQSNAVSNFMYRWFAQMPSHPLSWNRSARCVRDVTCNSFILWNFCITLTSTVMTQWSNGRCVDALDNCTQWNWRRENIKFLSFMCQNHYLMVRQTIEGDWDSRLILTLWPFFFYVHPMHSEWALLYSAHRGLQPAWLWLNPRCHAQQGNVKSTGLLQLTCQDPQFLTAPSLLLASASTYTGSD